MNPKVIIVGAGLAGLTTAYRLHQKGVDVHLYEARNRVGGRILTANICGHIAELGAQNISDGGEAENIHRLIQEFKLQLLSNQITLNQSYFTGEKLVSVQELLRGKKFHPDTLKVKLDDLVQKSQNMGEVLKGIFTEEDPLYKALAVRLAAYEGATIEKLSPLYAKTLYFMLFGGLASAHQSSGKEENTVNFLSIKEGNALLPEKLAEALEGRVYLNQPLRAISKDRDDTYILTFQDKQKVKADILVLAIPCSVFMGINIEENVISLDRQALIEEVHYGTNSKIIIPFAKAPLIRNGFINDRMGSFLDPNHHLLTLYYVGEASYFSKQTIRQLYSQEKSMVEKGFKDLDPSLLEPVFAKDTSFEVYEGPVGYSWPNDPYVRGSYSYIAAGQEEMLTATQEEQGEIVKSLFTPIDEKLHFAGEHASILSEVPGTMEAACESGERVSRMILKALKSRQR